MIVHAGGAIWLNPFATVLFNMCVVPSLYIAGFCTRAVWVCLLLCKEEGPSPVFFCN